MDPWIQWLLIVIGILASLVLAFFCLKQLRILRRAHTERVARERRRRHQHAHLVESVRVLVRCMLEEQMELSEGCIRIKVLLDTLAPGLLEDTRFQIFQYMYERTEHMPTHEARQQTDKRFIRRLDLQRFKLEREHREAIHQAARELLQLRFEFMADSVPAKVERRSDAS